MYIHNLFDVFVIIDELYQYLDKRDFCFDEDGFPVFKKEMFLAEWPDMVIPFSQRKNKRILDKRKTLLCFFDKDQKLYPRLTKIQKEIDEYKSFMGVVGLDLTITDDMDEEWQKAIFLLNQLFLAILAVNDIKIVANTRSGGLCAEEVFRNIPRGVMLASGFLGCDRLELDSDFSYLQKIMTLLPEKLVLYGKHDQKVESQLETIGINYRVYTDFHRLCKEVRNGR